MPISGMRLIESLSLVRYERARDLLMMLFSTGGHWKCVYKCTITTGFCLDVSAVILQSFFPAACLMEFGEAGLSNQ